MIVRRSKKIPRTENFTTFKNTSNPNFATTKSTAKMATLTPHDLKKTLFFEISEN